MFDVGFSELVLIALLALLLLGPKRLPEVARAAGKGLARVRHFINNVKSDLDAELRNAEIMELQRLKQELDETRRVLQKSSSGILESIARVPESAVARPDDASPSIGSPVLNAPAIAGAPSDSVPPRESATAAPRRAAPRKKAVSTPKKNGRARKAQRRKA